MKMDPYLPPNHPLSRVYRVGAALFGSGLTTFGALGFANRLAFFTTHGTVIWGLSSNGLLSTVSVLVGLVLVVASVLGGAISSTTNAAAGALFLLSGLVNLAVLDTPLNVFAFHIQNVVFSLIAGMLLLFVGLYGRVSGGLPEDNPYVRYRHHEPPDADHTAEREAERRRLAEIDELVWAELAVAEGRATPEQERAVRADAARRAAEARRHAYEHFQSESGPPSANNPYY
ncbi:DUF4383 domain-containing protein [Gandjariella thermophila]|uniref:DUF4383 domain-containing protein n=1 Tax=Gandjariella thermophila TaxID=1931992 RepID=A0A4D4J6K3_9PSEU|nr:DUF4383 domain-containing protein [Gandjariella thermophila]GDY30348.1 hypothetical protein GTS_19810 [Gandjariella thermophila]